MRSWPALFIAAVLTVTVPLVLVGCKERATKTAEAPAETDDHEGHDDEAESGAETKAGEEPEESADAVIADLESGVDAKVLEGLQQVMTMKSQTAREAARPIVRGLALSGDSSAEVREAALRAWVPWAAQDPEPALKAVDSPHAPVRGAAASALMAAVGPEADAALQKLKADADSGVKARAAEAIAQRLRSQESDNSIDLLIADLGHPDGDRSAQAGMTLEQRGRTDRRVVTKLGETLRKSQRPAQRHSCASVLALVCAGTNPGQERFAANVKATYRTAAETGPAYEAGAKYLIEALANDSEPMVREAAAFGLGMIGAPEAAKPLGRALSDPDRDVRRRAAAALVTVPPQAVREELVEAAKHDPSPAVRRFAVEAMANLDPADAGWAVASCLRDPDADVRMYACSVLKKVGTRAQTEALLKLFEDPDEDVRWKAVDAVASFADPEAKDELIATLNDPSARVALAAERGVHRLGIGTRVLTKDERFGARRK